MELGSEAEGETDIVATYNAWSATYDLSPNPLIPIEELTVRSLLRMLRYEDVLDAATGTGRYALQFARAGKRVVAIDASAGMLAVAQDKAQKEQFSITFQQDELARLSLADESFDLVVCALALAHNPDLQLPCRELVRVLRPGGNLIISDLHPWFQVRYGPTYQVELLPGQFLHFPTNVDHYLAAVTAAGATVVAAIDVPSRWILPEGEHIAVPGALVVWAQKV